ncbi:MAG: hypothetical protein ACT4QB_11600 [Gammaproteobacteria bacterium]
MPETEARLEEPQSRSRRKAARAPMGLCIAMNLFIFITCPVLPPGTRERDRKIRHFGACGKPPGPALV